MMSTQTEIVSALRSADWSGTSIGNKMIIQAAIDVLSNTRMFPMQGGPKIPWATAEVIYKAYAKMYGTEQTLERLEERGGFGWEEVSHMFAVLRRRDPTMFNQLISGSDD